MSWRAGVWLLVLVLPAASPSSAPAEPASSLLHVHAVWRHGDRTPSVLIPTDSGNGIETWPEGLGELTLKGAEQQFELGQLLRRRYDRFLGRYSPFSVYVRSSDYNRTLASAQANLAGLFPPDESEQFRKGLPWRPIPVHTVPKQDDKELYADIYCPHAATEESIVYSSPAVRQIEAAHRDLLEFVGVQSGLSEAGPLPLRDVWKVFDPLMSELFYRNDTSAEDVYELPLPSCGSPCLLERLREQSDELIPTNWEEECGLYQFKLGGNAHIYAGVTVLVILTIVLFAVCVQKYQAHSQPERPFPRYELLKEDLDVDL